MEPGAQDSLVTSSEDILQNKHTSTSEMQFLQLYHNKNRRKKNVKELGSIFPWYHNFEKLCLCKEDNALSMKGLLNLLMVYTEHVSKEVLKSYKRPNRATKLKKQMSQMLVFFHFFYINVKRPLDEPMFLEKMSVLLTMYIDMEIKSSRLGKESPKKIASTITSELFISLCGSSDFIIDTILKARFTVRSYRDICIPVFRRAAALPVSQDLTYVRFILMFQLWKQLVPSGEERNKINRLATAKLNPPPAQFLDMLEKGILANVLPTLPSYKKPATVTRFYMTSKFLLKKSIKAFFKLTSELKRNDLCTIEVFDYLPEQEETQVQDDEDNSVELLMDSSYEEWFGSSLSANDVLLDSRDKNKKIKELNKSLCNEKLASKSVVQKKNKKKGKKKEDTDLDIEEVQVVDCRNEDDNIIIVEDDNSENSNMSCVVSKDTAKNNKISLGFKKIFDINCEVEQTFRNFSSPTLRRNKVKFDLLNVEKEFKKEVIENENLEEESETSNIIKVALGSKTQSTNKVSLLKPGANCHTLSFHESDNILSQSTSLNRMCQRENDMNDSSSQPECVQQNKTNSEMINSQSKEIVVRSVDDGSELKENNDNRELSSIQMSKNTENVPISNILKCEVTFNTLEGPNQSIEANSIDTSKTGLQKSTTVHHLSDNVNKLKELEAQMRPSDNVSTAEPLVDSGSQTAEYQITQGDYLVNLNIKNEGVNNSYEDEIVNEDEDLIAEKQPILSKSMYKSTQFQSQTVDNVSNIRRSKRSFTDQGCLNTNTRLNNNQSFVKDANPKIEPKKDLNSCLLHVLGGEDCLKDTSNRYIYEKSLCNETSPSNVSSNKVVLKEVPLKENVENSSLQRNDRVKDCTVYIKNEEENENLFHCISSKRPSREMKNMGTFSSTAILRRGVDVFHAESELDKTELNQNECNNFIRSYDSESEDSNLVIDEDVYLGKEQKNSDSDESGSNDETDSNDKYLAGTISYSSVRLHDSPEQSGDSYKILETNEHLLSKGFVTTKSCGSLVFKKMKARPNDMCTSQKVSDKDKRKRGSNSCEFVAVNSLNANNTLPLAKVDQTVNLNDRINNSSSPKLLHKPVILQTNISTFVHPNQPESSMFIKDSSNSLRLDKNEISNYHTLHMNHSQHGEFISVSKSFAPSNKLSPTLSTHEQSRNYNQCNAENEVPLFPCLLPFKPLHEVKSAVNSYHITNKGEELQETAKSMGSESDIPVNYIPNEVDGTVLQDNHVGYLHNSSKLKQTCNQRESLDTNQEITSTEMLFNKSPSVLDPLCLVMKNNDVYRETTSDIELNIFTVVDHEVEICSAPDSVTGDSTYPGPSEIGHPNWPIAIEQNVIDSGLSLSSSDQFLYSPNITSEPVCVINENDKNCFSNTIELEQIGGGSRFPENAENNFNKLKLNLHMRTLERDSNLCCSQHKFKEFYKKQDISPSIPAPYPLNSSIRCKCDQCFENYKKLLNNYNMLTHYRNSKMKPLNDYSKRNNVSPSDKDQSCESDCSLPLKKRKTLTSTKTTTEPTMPSYPNTPMISIAELPNTPMFSMAQLQFPNFEQQNEVVGQRQWKDMSDPPEAPINPINLVQSPPPQQVKPAKQSKHTKRKSSKRRKSSRYHFI